MFKQAYKDYVKKEHENNKKIKKEYKNMVKSIKEIKKSGIKKRDKKRERKIIKKNKKMGQNEEIIYNL